MSIKISLTIISLFVLLFSELLSSINVRLWDITHDLPSDSEYLYYKNRLTNLYSGIEDSKIIFYSLFLFLSIVTIIIYFVI